MSYHNDLNIKQTYEATDSLYKTKLKVLNKRDDGLKVAVGFNVSRVPEGM
jgi:hypothetical protein